MNYKELECGSEADEEALHWSPFKQFGKFYGSIEDPFAEKTSLESQLNGYYIQKSIDEATRMVKQLFPSTRTCKYPCSERWKSLQILSVSLELQSSQNSGLKTLSNDHHDILHFCEESSLLWKSLVDTCYIKQKVKHKKTKWKRDYMRQLCLNQDVCNLHDMCSGNTSESSVEEEVGRDESNQEIFLNNLSKFYISQHGLAFTTQDEVDDFDSKMAEMETVLQEELKLIQHQHKQLLKARQSEERKLLKQRTDSFESEEDQEPTEYQQLNKSHSKTNSANLERKSTFLETLHNAVLKSSWLAGFLDKKTSQVTDNEDSDNEHGKETAADMEDVPMHYDNHDAFSRQMEDEGGLKYESQDKTVKHLAYDELPPPLSLGNLQDSLSSNS